MITHPPQATVLRAVMKATSCVLRVASYRYGPPGTAQVTMCPRHLLDPHQRIKRCVSDHRRHRHLRRQNLRLRRPQVRCKRNRRSSHLKILRMIHLWQRRWMARHSCAGYNYGTAGPVNATSSVAPGARSGNLCGSRMTHTDTRKRNCQQPHSSSRKTRHSIASSSSSNRPTEVSELQSDHLLRAINLLCHRLLQPRVTNQQRGPRSKSCSHRHSHSSHCVRTLNGESPSQTALSSCGRHRLPHNERRRSARRGCPGPVARQLTRCLSRALWSQPCRGGCTSSVAAAPRNLAAVCATSRAALHAL